MDQATADVVSLVPLPGFGHAVQTGITYPVNSIYWVCNSRKYYTLKILGFVACPIYIVH